MPAGENHDVNALFSRPCENGLRTSTKSSWGFDFCYFENLHHFFRVCYGKSLFDLCIFFLPFFTFLDERNKILLQLLYIIPFQNVAFSTVLNCNFEMQLVSIDSD